MNNKWIKLTTKMIGIVLFSIGAILVGILTSPWVLNGIIFMMIGFALLKDN